MSGMELGNMDLGNLTPSQRSEVMGKVKSQVAQAQAAEMVQKVNDRCVKKCIDYPGASLSSSQQTCLTRCMERYFEAYNVVAKAYQDRLQRESGGGGLM